MKIIPVLLAGGIGERFWPASRSTMPKQLLPLVTNRSMLEDTLLRVKPLCNHGAKPLVICGSAIAGHIKKRLPSSFHYDLIAEPQGKNTAPAVALAAAWLDTKYKNPVMLVLSADHAISPVGDYLSAAKYAASLADTRNSLVVFGIKPKRPDTGYGYIHLGKQLGNKQDASAFEVRRFVEKPDLKTAKSYCKQGVYLWNSGMFVWKTSVILDEFKQHMPGLYKLAMVAAKDSFSKTAIARFYRDCEKESIDYGIMEHSKRVVAVAGTFAWDDVGSWESVARVKGVNADHTAVSGKKIFEYDCSNSIIVNNSPLTLAAFGVNNIVLVATQDAVMAIPREKLGAIKEYLAKMKKEKTVPRELF